MKVLNKIWVALLVANFCWGREEVVLFVGGRASGKTIFTQSLCDEKKIKITEKSGYLDCKVEEKSLTYRIRRRKGKRIALVDVASFLYAVHDFSYEERERRFLYWKTLKELFDRFSVRGIVFKIGYSEMGNSAVFYSSLLYFLKIFPEKNFESFLPYIKIVVENSEYIHDHILFFCYKVQHILNKTERETDDDDPDASFYKLKLRPFLKHLLKKVESPDEWVEKWREKVEKVDKDFKKTLFPSPFAPSYYPNPDSVWVGSILKFKVHPFEMQDKPEGKFFFSQNDREEVWKFLSSFPKKPLDKKKLALEEAYQEAFDAKEDSFFKKKPTSNMQNAVEGSIPLLFDELNKSKGKKIFKVFCILSLPISLGVYYFKGGKSEIKEEASDELAEKPSA